MPDDSDPTDDGDPRDALEQHTTDHRIVRRLHAVPPHTVHEVRFGGRRAVCKVGGPPADPVTEARVTAFVGEHTSLPVPEVLAVGRDPDHYIAAWHDAAPDPKDPHLDATRARALGRGLATLHAETAPRFGATGNLRGHVDPGVGEGGLAFDASERWSETLVERIAARRDWLAAAGRPTDADVAAAESVARFVREHRDLFDAAATGGGAALLHGTYLPDHVGTDGDRVACVIDFEHALVGPPEYDYLRTAIPVFGGDADHGVPESVFREAYESVRPLPEGFDRRREAHVLVQTVSYLRALYVQDQHPDVEGRAELFRDHVARQVDALD